MMQLHAKIIQMTAIVLLMAGLTGCQTWVKSGLGVTPINKIENNWQQYSKVYLRGTVKQVVPFVDSAAYELADESGDIWVFTQISPPARGEKILIQGQVKYQSIPIAEQDFGEVYVEEIQQLEFTETIKKPIKL